MIRKSIVIIFHIVLLVASNLGAASLEVTARNIADNQQAYSISFGTITGAASFINAEQYIELNMVAYTDVPLWQMDIYTDNGSGQPGHQKGGLINVANNNGRLPLSWKVSTTNAPSLSGNPNNAGMGWYWLKDKNDIDIPGTSANESWSAAQAGRYTTVCYGGVNKAYLNDGAVAPSSLNVFVQGDFTDVPAGEYRGTIWFEMYPVLAVSSITIQHAPINSIVGDKNRFFVRAEMSSSWDILWANLHYRIDSGSWQVKRMSMAASVKSTRATGIIEPAELKGASSLEYAIETYDGWNDPCWWASKTTPQTVTIVKAMLYNGMVAGELTIPDGNPEDGATLLNIPPGALNGPVDISIRQLDVNSVPVNSYGIAGYSDKPFNAYDFLPDGLVFNIPVTMTLLYYDLDNDGLVELPDGTETQVNETDLLIAWWDSFQWRMLGGVVDTALNTVTIQTNHFCIYAVFAGAPASADFYRPKEKIITPATPGDNDFATFDGLAGSDFSITIFDMSGRKVRTIAYPSLPQWDGKDDGAAVVESGVYIYQFEADVNGSIKRISGTITVAK
ncbi:MAG: hypothetical protein A2219_08700 [Elusimicrobia bacterium RIFOXYA2_FULL_50_26]|nr:MAG: hypothetical protein A2219_08700 [Elusimicrobia bacterium RIFOXYA2_FULL_50_26]OGS25144.1 MAG: hypothetical protein A2314_02775 [Elusimicrobia bacterium RIFOXYB2_FULL_50_12]